MKMIKIEIIISNSFLQTLIEQLESLDIHGYTAIEIFRGKGVTRGEQVSEGLLPITRNTLLFTIAPETQAYNIREELKDFLSETGGVMIANPLEFVEGIS